MKGAGGKAFCVGGDIKTLYLLQKGLIDNPGYKKPMDYMRIQFITDYLMAKMTPIQISIWDGYVMGGGAGISIHSTVKIATENTVFAMPEAKIGYFTDVGGGYFLSKLKNSIGIYLGLTGSQLKGEDVVKAGLADYFIYSKDLPNFEKLIKDLCNSSDYQNKSQLEKDVYKIIEKFKKKSLFGKIDNEYLTESEISHIFGQETFELLHKELRQSKSMTKKLHQIEANNPLSSKIIFEQMKRIPRLQTNLKDALKMDYRIAYRFFRENDFYEGVRCALFDKSDKPQFQYKSLDEISPEIVESYFREIPDGDELE